MQQPNETTPAEPSTLDDAVKRSERNWDRAGDAVEDLQKLGHEEENDDDVENP